MNLPTDKHIAILCHTCREHHVVGTKTYHYCSEKCAKQYFTDYWRNRWKIRKTDPVAKEHARKAVLKYRMKKAL